MTNELIKMVLLGIAAWCLVSVSAAILYAVIMSDRKSESQTEDEDLPPERRNEIPGW